MRNFINIINEAQDFKNWTFELKPGDKTKVVSGDHVGTRGEVTDVHDDGESYTIKDRDGKEMRHHISTLAEPQD